MCSKTTHFVFSLQFFSEEEIEQNWFSILFRKRKQSNFGFQISSAFISILNGVENLPQTGIMIQLL